ncbi:hypothetical protein PPS11_08230 [Pseudomonas putida S11]|nr:hypothetical protein PPS11_08230 [Pseudomonas putida S11]
MARSASVMPGAAVVQADAVAEAPGGREDRPGGDADALGQGHVEQLEGVHLFGQLQPQEVAAGRLADPRLRRKVPGDGRQHVGLLAFQGIAQLAQVAVVAAVLQVVGDGRLGRHRGAQRGHQLEPLDLLCKAPGCYPADAVARCQALGERAAVHHQPLGVEGLGRFGCLLRVVQFGVHVVFDQWHLMTRQQLHQCLSFSPPAYWRPRGSGSWSCTTRP